MYKIALIDRPLSVIDVETTGLDPRKNAMIEVGVVKLSADTLEEIDTYSSLIKLDPTALVEPRAMAVNRINTADLETSPELKDVMICVSHFIMGTVLTGHNVQFDRGFLMAAFEKAGVQCPQIEYHSLDTASLAWPLLRQGKVPGVSLKHLADYFNLSRENEHRALFDARRTAALLRILLKQP